MTNEIADQMRRAAKMPIPPVMWCEQAASEIDRLQRMLESEIDARNKCMAALRGKDQAMEVLFDRLRKAGVDYSDLIP